MEEKSESRRAARSTFVTSSLGLSSRHSLSVLNLRPLASGARQERLFYDVCLLSRVGERRKKVFLYDDRLVQVERADYCAARFAAAEVSRVKAQGPTLPPSFPSSFPFVLVSSKLQSLPSFGWRSIRLSVEGPSSFCQTSMGSRHGRNQPYIDFRSTTCIR